MIKCHWQQMAAPLELNCWPRWPQLWQDPGEPEALSEAHLSTVGLVMELISSWVFGTGWCGVLLVIGRLPVRFPQGLTYDHRRCLCTRHLTSGYTRGTDLWDCKTLQIKAFAFTIQIIINKYDLEYISLMCVSLIMSDCLWSALAFWKKLIAKMH